MDPRSLHLTDLRIVLLQDEHVTVDVRHTLKDGGRSGALYSLESSMVFSGEL